MKRFVEWQVWKKVSPSRCIKVCSDGSDTWKVWRMKDLRKKIYNAKACERRSRGRPRLTYEDQIKRVLSDGKIKSTRHRRKCMKGLMSVEEAKEICKSRVKWRSILSAYPARDMAWWYVCMYVEGLPRRITGIFETMCSAYFRNFGYCLEDHVFDEVDSCQVTPGFW